MENYKENNLAELFTALSSSHCFFFFIRADDPIFTLATPLQLEEVQSHSREVVAPPNDQNDCSDDPEEQKPTSVQGGWFGRGYGKGRQKKKKVA